MPVCWLACWVLVWICIYGCFVSASPSVLSRHLQISKAFSLHPFNSVLLFIIKDSGINHPVEVMAKTRVERLESQYWHAKGPLGLYSRTFLRTSQFILSLIIIGIYGPDLANATKSSSTALAPWVVVILISFASGVTCIVHVFATVIRVALASTWDFMLAVMWAAMTGTFGVVFVSGKQDKEKMADFTLDTTRMKVGVWLDLIMMILWLSSSFQGCLWCCTARKLTRRTDIPAKDDDNVVSKDLENGESRSRSEDSYDSAEMVRISPPSSRSDALSTTVKKDSEKGDFLEEQPAGSSAGAEQRSRGFEFPPPVYSREL